MFEVFMMSTNGAMCLMSGISFAKSIADHICHNLKWSDNEAPPTFPVNRNSMGSMYDHHMEQFHGKHHNGKHNKVHPNKGTVEADNSNSCDYPLEIPCTGDCGSTHD